ncbi:MAG: ribonuclease [Deltaproteobacteria bacterium]|nr:MAG: ribonuclease [Deltaproteobacteria bacterium]
MSKILINAVDSEECRIAKVKEGHLEEFHIENAGRQITRGNIFKGIVTRVEPSLQAAFIEYGGPKHGFLQKHEIHSDYYRDDLQDNRSIKHLVKRGQELLVQVTKDPEGTKGAMLTTMISLPGRYMVLMPGSENKGISRKIEDEEERRRLKEIISGINVPDGYGLIVRTAGKKCSKTVILNDYRYLMRLWKTIKGNVMKVQAPALLYQERNLVERSLRDYFTTDITEILIDDESAYREAKQFMRIISPKYGRIVKRYKGTKPIFSKYELESQIAMIFENRVPLKSGGSLVIEPTEALVAIDVNSGKATSGASIEETAYKINIEAAEEIARQLRLRDLGGLIVLDFIDMKDKKHRRKVEQTLKKYLKTDKAKSSVGLISKFGLLEMSRQRIRPSIRFGSYEICRYCRGKGAVPSVDTLGLKFLRELNSKTLKSNLTRIRGVVPRAVADYLLNKKRKDLIDIEASKNIEVVIEASDHMIPGDSEIVQTLSSEKSGRREKLEKTS